MKRTLIALVAIAALFTLTSPAMAFSAATCAFLAEVSQMVGGAIDGVVANNCGTPPPPANTTPGPVGGGTVATTEPLVALGVGLGLLGAGLLRRR